MLAEKNTAEKWKTPESKEQGKEIKMVLKLSLVEHKLILTILARWWSCLAQAPGGLKHDPWE